MRDSYGRIRPDFEAWEKLGWKLVEIHEQTYILADKEDDPWEQTNICCEYETETNDSKKPEYTKYYETIGYSKKLEFTEEEKAQVEKDIKNWEEEMAAELDYQRSIEQVEHDELYEPTYDPETGAM